MVASYTVLCSNVSHEFKWCLRCKSFSSIAVQCKEKIGKLLSGLEINIEVQFQDFLSAACLPTDQTLLN